MMRKLSLLLVAVFMCVAASAQYCGFDKVHKQMLAANPAFAQRVHSADSNLAALLATNPNALIINTPNGPVYDIPVVIHVLHTGGTVGTIYNPTDAVLQGMITYLNESYAATYASYPNATSGGTAFPIQFTLAKRDLNCNATTTGIVRVNAVAALGGSSSTNGAAYISDGVMYAGTAGVSETTLKNLSRWNNNDYYNIWVVNKIDGMDGTTGTFVAGYAYYPGASAALDGTIMLATRAVSGSSTIVHEIGHAFSLHHTFYDDDPLNTGAATTCPTNTNCNLDGDLVCDTDPHMRSTFNCQPTATNSCTGLPYGNVVRNFMDYSSCKDRFTPGQRTRFMNALLTERASLISSLGATAIGTAPAASNCQPTMPFPFSATGQVGVYETKITEAVTNNFIMVATSEGGYTLDGNLEYIDRSCFQRANLTAGGSYNLSVTTGPNREYVRVYVDYNNDGVFNTTTELIYSHNGTLSTPYEVHSTTYTVPTTGVTFCTPLRMRVITDRNNGVVAAPTPCIALTHGQAEDYSVFIKPAANATVSLALTTGSNPSCNNTTLGFTASNTGTPTSPSLRIYVNGIQVSATSTFSSSTLATGDVVTAKLFFTGSCGADSLTSNAITVTRNAIVAPTVSIAVTAGTNPGCAGQSITFTATPTNGGTGPTYKWFVNSAQVTGVTGNTFTTTTLPCNSTVQAQLTSNSACASTPTANSNVINYTCGPQAIGVTAAVTGGSNPTCAGRNVTFTATPFNGGSAPTYQWYINGIVVTGATGTNFTTNVLGNGDTVHVVMTSNFTCAATPTTKSPAISMTVIPTVTPTVTKAITLGANPGCIGDPLQFTATPSNAGSSPAYRWFLNGNPIPFATGPTYTFPTGGTSGDRVWVRVVASNASTSCYITDTAYSDTTILDRRPVPSLPLISFIGNDLVSDSVNVQWWGPAGLIPGATGPVYTPTVHGDYYAVIKNPICGSGKSNVLTISPLTIGNYKMDGVQLFPNPTSGQLTITWSAASTTRITVYTATGKALLHDMANLATRKVLDLSTFPSGIYFVQLQDEKGNSGAVRVTVAH